ncbi:MAG: hypothetical protein AAFN12_13480, partial [Cyanobacteria bacterium J06560_2]
EAYRLREKISYHAIRIFTLKAQPDLVFSWLKTSLQHHNLGLTATEWQKFQTLLTPAQTTLLTALKSGQTIPHLAQTLDLTPKQVTSKWAEIYLLAQETRSEKESA